MKGFARIVPIGFMALALGGSPAVAGVDIHISVPPPPSFVIEAPPHLVVVPGYPAVRYAPDVPYNYFVYGGRYYTLHDDAWFVSPSYGGPWTYVERTHVPRSILYVPNRYYRVPPRVAYREYHRHPHGMPPGQAKKIYGHEYKHGHGHGHGHHDD